MSEAEEKAKQEAIEAFTRQTRKTAALMHTAIDFCNAFGSLDSVPFHLAVERMRQITGVYYSEDDVRSAFKNFRETNRFVEESQFNDNIWEH